MKSWLIGKFTREFNHDYIFATSARLVAHCTRTDCDVTPRCGKAAQLDGKVLPGGATVTHPNGKVLPARGNTLPPTGNRLAAPWQGHALWWHRLTLATLGLACV
jgi:hypothetical protein